MQSEYTVEEILHAVEDLQKKRREREIIPSQKDTIVNSSNIPKDTLKLIEEAEKNKN
jgi:hypothetical protein